MKNPLRKRIPKELVSEWHKYLVIVLFMVVMIGVVSGMYVGHDGMLKAIAEGRGALNLEDGSFELANPASENLLTAMESGQMADVKQYFIEKGMGQTGQEEGKSLAGKLFSAIVTGVEKKAVTAAVEERWDEIAKEYQLEEDFDPVPVTLYENFYRNEPEDNNRDGEEDAVIRIFQSDSPVNKASFLEGRTPETSSEIAIDRMHADNVGLTVGDQIRVGGLDFEIVGLISYVNYLTLHESNTDLMFDAFGFDVGMVLPEAFDRLSSRLHYNYAYFYEQKPADKAAQAEYADNFLKALITQTLVYENEIENFVPEYLRQASNFAPSDIESDTAGTAILCYILIAVIAFVFAITIGNTIEKEAQVIGTLRASGYTKGELIIHYMTLPIIVTLAGAILGNLLGYTAFQKVAVDLYYNSYSLPACEPVFSQEGFRQTTIIPLVLMFLINLAVIVRKLQLSPLKFLRRDLRRARRSKARRLPSWSFLRRFRLRVILQNGSNYAVLIFGVIFIELMLCFAFGLPDSLTHYSEMAPDMMFADYQYMLMGNTDRDGKEIKTQEPSAEKFSSTSLQYEKNVNAAFEGMGSGGDETVTIYGICADSAYIDLPEDLTGREVFVSSAFRDKFGLSPKDEITLHEEYANRSYTFTVQGITEYDGGIAVFMPNENFNHVFGKALESFNGFLSQKQITDIDEQYIAMVITQEDITKVTNQLMHSMGQFFWVFKAALVVLSAALIYLLARIIIERNEKSISMAKILGFQNGEIGSLYILPTALVVAASALVSFAVGYVLMIWVFKIFMMQMDGYFSFYMSKRSMILSVLYLLIGYAFVSVIDFRRIKKIPMDQVLKDME